jgi:internalin A
MNDLSYFLEDTSIKSLRLYGGTFSDLSPLAELTELEDLEINSNYFVNDISPIASLSNLKRLSLYIENLESIAPISSLTNLTHLYLIYNGRIYDELAPLKHLEYFSLIISSKGSYNASYISHLHSLTSLYIAAESISNIDLLQNLVNLENLEIYSSSDLDISWITPLQKIKKLLLRGERIDDLSPLLELPNLVDIDLYETVVKDIRPLAESRSIKTITGFILENENDYPYSLFKERGIETKSFWSLF